MAQPLFLLSLLIHYKATSLCNFSDLLVCRRIKKCSDSISLLHVLLEKISIPQFYLSGNRSRSMIVLSHNAFEFIEKYNSWIILPDCKFWSVEMLVYLLSLSFSDNQCGLREQGQCQWFCVV